MLLKNKKELNEAKISQKYFMKNLDMKLNKIYEKYNSLIVNENVDLSKISLSKALDKIVNEEIFEFNLLNEEAKEEKVKANKEKLEELVDNLKHTKDEKTKKWIYNLILTIVTGFLGFGGIFINVFLGYFLLAVQYFFSVKTVQAVKEYREERLKTINILRKMSKVAKDKKLKNKIDDEISKLEIEFTQEM